MSRIAFTLVALVVSSALCACSEPLPTCATGEPLGKRVFVTASDVPMYLEPSATSAKVVNERATAVLGSVQYRTLSSGYGLRGLCKKPGWTQVKIVESDAKAVEWETGWIESRYLQGAPTADQAAGLMWTPEGDAEVREADRSIVRANALRVLRKDPNCKAILVGAYSSQPPGQFFVTCAARNDAGNYNVFFSTSDSATAGALRAPTAIEIGRARQLCASAIRAEATVPASVELHDLTGFATTEHNNGNRTIVQAFSAANAFGAKQEFVGRCLVEPNGNTELTVSEK